MNKAIINYTEKTLVVTYDNETHSFDLTKGDTGEFWFGFQHKEKVMDVAFFQEDKSDNPSVSVYPIKNEAIDSKGEISIKDIEVTGNPDDYFGTEDNEFTYYE